MKTNALLALSIVAVGALAFVVVHQRNEIGDLKRAVQEAANRSAPPPERQRAVPPVEELPAEPSAIPAPPPLASTPAPKANSGSASNFFAGLAGMMKDPAMKDMIRMQQKVALDRQYGSLTKYLKLPVEKLSALKALLADRQTALTEAGMKMMGGSPTDRKQAVEDSKAVKDDYDKQIEELLGPQNYPTFQDYEKTSSERMQVQMFKDALPAEAALTDQQEDSLIAAMYDERKNLPSSSLLKSQNPDPSLLTEDSIKEALKQMDDLQKRYADRAATILSPAQLEQFTVFEKQMSAMQVAGMKMAATMFGNRPALLAPPQ